MQKIIDNPMIGQDADLSRVGLRKITVGRHVIFYIADEHEITVVRILHQAMDVEQHLL